MFWRQIFLRNRRHLGGEWDVETLGVICRHLSRVEAPGGELDVGRDMLNAICR